MAAAALGAIKTCFRRLRGVPPDEAAVPLMPQGVAPAEVVPNAASLNQALIRYINGEHNPNTDHVESLEAIVAAADGLHIRETVWSAFVGNSAETLNQCMRLNSAEAQLKLNRILQVVEKLSLPSERAQFFSYLKRFENNQAPDGFIMDNLQSILRPSTAFRAKLKPAGVGREVIDHLVFHKKLSGWPASKMFWSHYTHYIHEYPEAPINASEKRLPLCLAACFAERTMKTWLSTPSTDHTLGAMLAAHYKTGKRTAWRGVMVEKIRECAGLGDENLSAIVAISPVALSQVLAEGHHAISNGKRRDPLVLAFEGVLEKLNRSLAARDFAGFITLMGSLGLLYEPIQSGNPATFDSLKDTWGSRNQNDIKKQVVKALLDTPAIKLVGLLNPEDYDDAYKGASRRATAARATTAVVTGLGLAGGVVVYDAFRPTPPQTPAAPTPIPSDCPAAMTTTSDGSGGTILALATADGGPFVWQVGSTIQLIAGTFESAPFGWTLSPDKTLLTAADADLLGTQVDVQISSGAVGTAAPLGLEGKTCPLTFSVQPAAQWADFAGEEAPHRYLRGTHSDSSSPIAVGMGSSDSAGRLTDNVVGAAAILVLFFVALLIKKCRAPAPPSSSSQQAVTPLRDLTSVRVDAPAPANSGEEK